MPAHLPPSTIGRCSASSRSFLRGPDGPAGAPPGQDLRSGALIGLRENREPTQDPYYKVSTVRGEPRTATRLEYRPRPQPPVDSSGRLAYAYGLDGQRLWLRPDTQTLAEHELEAGSGA